MLGLAVGFELLALVRFVCGDQAYVYVPFPEPPVAVGEPPKLRLCPKQIVVEIPASTTGETHAILGVVI